MLPSFLRVPLLAKINTIRAELIKAERASSPNLLHVSSQKVTDRLVSNGYPPKLISSRIVRKPSSVQDSKYTTFLRIPYICERQCQQIRRLLRVTGMQHTVRLIFTTERSLAWQFRPARELPTCPSTCGACATASKQGLCFKETCRLQNTMRDMWCCIYWRNWPNNTHANFRTHWAQQLHCVRPHGHTRLR
jgi:hypothetical protein